MLALLQWSWYCLSWNCFCCPLGRLWCWHLFAHRITLSLSLSRSRLISFWSTPQTCSPTFLMEIRLLKSRYAFLIIRNHLVNVFFFFLGPCFICLAKRYQVWPIMVWHWRCAYHILDVSFRAEEDLISSVGSNVPSWGTCTENTAFLTGLVDAAQALGWQVRSITYSLCTLFWSSSKGWNLLQLLHVAFDWVLWRRLWIHSAVVCTYVINSDRIGKG